MPSAQIVKHWDETVQNMAAVLTMLRDECGVLAPKWLPYQPMLIPLTGAWQEVAGSTGPLHGAMRAKLKRWFWCACFTGEYESSSSSLVERDTPKLRAWLKDGPELPVVEGFRWSGERWRSVTARQHGLYQATMALALIDHPLDFYTGAPLTPEVMAAGHVDDHHVFPQGYLKDISREDETDTVLNHTLIDRGTNGRILKKAPSEYLKEIREVHGGNLDRILASHSLPTGPDSSLATDDFDAFLAWRIKRLLKALTDQVGDFTSLEVDEGDDRTELDKEVETLERRLRDLVADALDGKVEDLPIHVRDNAKKRIATALTKNPARGSGHYETLTGHLEYCDLRELQDVITAKTLWEQFEPRFGNKESVNNRFAQLAELRNTLAHTRTLDDVTRKDGEAAILWFQQVLARSN
jgi:hypothetical protein